MTWILLAALLIVYYPSKLRMGPRILRLSWAQIPLLRGTHRMLLQYVRPHLPAPIRAQASHPKRAHAAGNWDAQHCLERSSECRRSRHSKRSMNSYFSGFLCLFHGFRNRVVLSFQIEARWLGIRTTTVGKRKGGLGVRNWGHRIADKNGEMYSRYSRSASSSDRLMLATATRRARLAICSACISRYWRISGSSRATTWLGLPSSRAWLYKLPVPPRPVYRDAYDTISIPSNRE